MGRLFGEVPRLRPTMEALLAEIEAGRLRPVVARAFPFDRAADAHYYLHQRKNIGKIVLTT
jgi:NADPH:quinone reductase-like Zn-dependent oxidoreductase